MSPEVFIPFAEESALIDGISRWMLDEIGRQWIDNAPAARGAAPPMVLVNLSGRQLDTNLRGLLGALAQTAERLPGGLGVEITEHALAANLDDAAGVLGRLRSLGISVIIDDFGTGHASFGYVRSLPADALKIDRSFIEHLGRGRRDEAIIASMIDLAHTLDITAIAEGVETGAQLRSLCELGCDCAQGFHIAMPAPIDRVSW